MSGNSSRHSPPPDLGRFPTASDIVRSILDDRPPTSNVSPSGELYRAIERFHRNLARGHRETPPSAGQPSEPTPTMSSGSEGNLRRRFNRDPHPHNFPPHNLTLPSISTVTDSIPGLQPLDPPLPPLRSLGSRRGSGMSTPGAGPTGRPGRYRAGGDRHPERFRTNFDNGGINTSFEDLDRNLEDANSHLRALLDFTTNSPIIPPLMSPSASTPPDHPEDNRRVKRRKLDSDKSAPSYKGFRYGKYGQVEPGPLTMEIVSCDGGLFSNEASYAAENILRKDSSVYCTKGNRCNIVLRHQGSTVFSLQELVVKAPGFNYTSPVREGMIFVAMESDDLLARTAQYQIQYISPRGSDRHGDQRGGSQGIPAIYSIRHDEDGNPVAGLQSRFRPQYALGMDGDDDENEDNEEDGDEDEDDENEDGRVAHIPAEFAASPPPFTITTECSEDDDEEEEESDPEPLIGDLGFRRPRRETAPNRIGSLPFEGDSSDEGEVMWGYPSAPWPTFEDLRREFHRSQFPDSPEGPDGGGERSLAEARETAQIATQEAVRAVGGELMTPLARFYIEKDKSKCTIRFDPPVSGRFILLKMWSPHHDPSANIDIQGVVAKGFAGPRYFPAVELR